MFIRGKKADSFCYRFTNGEGKDIFDVYERPSNAKVQAFEECRKKCAGMGGYNLGIISHNTFGFTCGWLTMDATGKFTLHVKTPNNYYEMEYWA